jgi:hypothetical protein
VPPFTGITRKHLAGIVTAAVFADAAHIVEEIVLAAQNPRHSRRGG